MPAEMPDIGPRVGFLRQRSNRRAASRLIDDLAPEIERLPEGEEARRRWREDVREAAASVVELAHDLGPNDG